MKKLIAIICALACSLSFFSCKNEKRSETVKDIKEGEAVVGKEYYEDDKLVREELFDKAGEVIKKVYYSDSEKVEKEEEYTLGKLYSDVVYTYGEDGKSTSKKNTYNKDGEIKTVTDSNYTDGKLKKETVSTVDKDGKATVTEENHYKYNEDGTVVKTQKKDDKKVKDTVSDKDGKILYTVDYLESGSMQKKHFNEKGKTVKIENFNKDGVIVRTIENLYDEMGKTLGYREYDVNGNLAYYGEYEYVEGKLKKIAVYDENDVLVRTMVYNENGEVEIIEAE